MEDVSRDTYQDRLANFMNPKYYQNEIWSNTSVLCGKHFEHVFGSVLEIGNLFQALS